MLRNIAAALHEGCNEICKGERRKLGSQIQHHARKHQREGEDDVSEVRIALDAQHHEIPPEVAFKRMRMALLGDRQPILVSR